MIHRLEVGLVIEAATTTRTDTVRGTGTVREVIQEVAISGAADILVLIMAVRIDMDATWLENMVI